MTSFVGASRSAAIHGSLTTALLTRLSTPQGPLGQLAGGQVACQGVLYLFTHNCWCDEALAGAEGREGFLGGRRTRAGCLLAPSDAPSSQSHWNRISRSLSRAWHGFLQAWIQWCLHLSSVHFPPDGL